MENKLNIFTHHKCASSWLTRYLSEFCTINCKKFAVTHFSNLYLDDSAHIRLFTNSSYTFIKSRIDCGLHIFRNPLDIIVSAYYSHRSTHSLDDWPQLVEQRRILQNVSKQEGMFSTLAFLEREDFYDGSIGPLCALRNWDFADTRYATITMEKLVHNPRSALGSVLIESYTGSILPADDDYTFMAMCGRQIGEIDDNSHYRSGEIGQWRTELPDDLVQYVKKNYGFILSEFYHDAETALI
jgi:hypothetical protein